MTFRDVLAALLIAAGVGSVSWGAFLVSPAAGFGVFGALLVVIGTALGVGEVGRAPTPETTADATPDPTIGTLGPARIQHKEGERADGDGDEGFITLPPSPPSPPPPSVAKTIPISSYIGVRGQEVDR